MVSSVLQEVARLPLYIYSHVWIFLEKTLVFLFGMKYFFCGIRYLAKQQSGLDIARFPFFVLRHEVSLGRKTLDPIFRIAAWSLNATYRSISSLRSFLIFWPPDKYTSFGHNYFKLLYPLTRTQVAFSGIWPTVDVDGKQLTDPKSIRRAGTAMADKWAVTEFRGDWTLGVPNLISLYSLFFFGRGGGEFG